MVEGDFVAADFVLVVVIDAVLDSLAAGVTAADVGEAVLIEAVFSGASFGAASWDVTLDGALDFSPLPVVSIRAEDLRADAAVDFAAALVTEAGFADACVAAALVGVFVTFTPAFGLACTAALIKGSRMA